MLKPGTYKLSGGVTNPKPDKRKTTDWRATPTWKEGEEFIVEEYTHRELDDEPRVVLTRIIKVGHRWRHENIVPGEQYSALEAWLVPCEMSDEAFFTAHEINEYFPRWLIKSGRMSRALLLKLWSEMEDDGELRASDPYPQRALLVEPALDLSAARDDLAACCTAGHPWSPLIGSCIGPGCGEPKERS